MKNYILTTALLAMALTACKTNEDPSDGIDNNAMDTAVMNNDDNDTQQFATNDQEPVRRYSNEDAQRLRSDFSNAVAVENDRATQVKGWTVYSTVNADLEELRNTPDEKVMTSTQQLRADYNILMSTIPAYLMVDDVRDAIADVNKEITEFEKEVAIPTTTRKENMENLEEIQEAYDDLAKEIAQARAKYVDNQEDAMEEYLEEINNIDDKKTTMQRYEDAAVEYNEELDSN
ncbi:hypothetical protein [Nonlabens ponticola]|uniref:Uncharacterized protein n=1 Tax=Nonlabens ponticola TaxID=2496866 RepID=A0A3S9MWA4_9FLAO|nr:hypothetical protein [Nonlabens ponticola]AZQ43478.1 hypothetical protein EJ995_04235 [Nonlabens ponticola]